MTKLRLGAAFVAVAVASSLLLAPAHAAPSVSAERGPGNLLGNLLCAIAGLLDPGVDLPDILARLLTVLTKLRNLFS